MPKPAEVAQAARPSQPPPKPDTPKRGIAVWDQATKQVIWMPSETSTSAQPPRRRIEVTPAPSSRTSKPGARPSTPSAPRNPPTPSKSPTATPTQQPSTVDPKRKPVIKIEQQISLQELARRMNLKATEVLMKLLQVGGAGKNINSTLDADTATLLASEFGFTVEDVALDTEAIIKKALPPDTVQDSSPRPPVVTVMGHVDHGKTTLLDAILGTRVAEGEAGGITQEVRAYRVNTAKGPVVFFDTPGHEAFTELRSRGAQATDVAVLVVAADDGVMPTTIEAINHVKAAKVPIVVALNKMDKPDANPDKVIRELMEQGVVPSEYGGDTLVVKVSAKFKQGIDELLETLAFQTEYLGLKANAKKAGVGTVFESKLDKGRGAVARVLVQEGVIRNGDVVLVGSSWGRIRAMFDDRGKAIDKAGPSTPVEILGLSEPPNAGDKIYVCADARRAQEAAEQLKAAMKKAPGQRATVDIASLIGDGNEKVTIHTVIKADAQGAVEGLKKALTELSTDKVEVKVLHAAVGAITETDVQLAVPARAWIIGFNVRPAGKAAALAEEQKVTMRFYNVIYEAVDDMKKLMEGQLKPTLVEKTLGKAEVRQVFNITKVGLIAGCMVLDGVIRRGAQVRLVRDGVQVWEGKIGSVRRVKEDVSEVKQGFECGIGLENTPAIKPGDIIEAFETEEVAARL
jgi:translation initiation factor IF-2